MDSTKNGTDNPGVTHPIIKWEDGQKKPLMKQKKEIVLLSYWLPPEQTHDTFGTFSASEKYDSYQDGLNLDCQEEPDTLPPFHLLWLSLIGIFRPKPSTGMFGSLPMQIQYNGLGGCFSQLIGLFTCCGCLAVILAFLGFLSLTVLAGIFS